jgi:hypothetical protein
MVGGGGVSPDGIVAAAVRGGVAKAVLLRGVMMNT